MEFMTKWQTNKSWNVFGIQDKSTKRTNINLLELFLPESLKGPWKKYQWTI